jgi:hypothetical protein
MKKSRRNNQGNMFIIVALVLGLTAMALVVGMSFGGLYFAQNILQNYANELALSGATVLNGSDTTQLSQGINTANREGQMNDMIMRTRVLVKDSREMMDLTDQEISGNESFRNLADQLLDESTQSAKDMEIERKKLKQVSEQEATDLIKNRLASISKLNVKLPWIQMSSPRLFRLKGIVFGQVRDMQSNVEQLSEANNLQPEDQNYVASNKHYNAGANARLKGPEGSLDFKVSSLQPASLNKEVGPARLILPSSFSRTRNADDLSSAVQVSLIMDVRTTIGAVTDHQIMVRGIAATTGASSIRRDDSEFTTFE